MHTRTHTHKAKMQLVFEAWGSEGKEENWRSRSSLERLRGEEEREEATKEQLLGKRGGQRGQCTGSENWGGSASREGSQGHTDASGAKLGKTGSWPPGLAASRAAVPG